MNLINDNKVISLDVDQVNANMSKVYSLINADVEVGCETAQTPDTDDLLAYLRLLDTEKCEVEQ